MGQRQESRKGESIAAMVLRFVGVLLFGPLSKFSPLNAEVIAASVVRCTLESVNGVKILYYNDINKYKKL